MNNFVITETIIDLIIVILFAVALSISLRKARKLRKENIELSTTLASINKSGDKDELILKEYKSLLHQLYHSSMALRESYKDSISVALYFSNYIISSKSLRNIEKIHFLENLISDECAVLDFICEAFEASEKQNITDKGSGSGYKEALEGYKAMKKRYEEGENLCKNITELIDASSDKKMDVSTHKVAEILIKMVNFLASDTDLEGNENARSMKDSLERINKLGEKLKDLTSNESDFQPFADNDDKSEGKSEKESHEVNIFQTKEGISDFEKRRNELHAMAEVLSYTKAEDLTNYNNYMSSIAKFASSVDAEGISEQDLSRDFTEYVVTPIPEITSISLYSVWYKFFKHTEEFNKLNSVDSLTPNIYKKAIYIAQVKVEALLEGFEKKSIGTEDEQKIENVKNAFEITKSRSAYLNTKR